ncbi:Carboxypeptidase B [Diplonema papillatum]|nr:Carboxypeptidase B [Diplonema papillatum]
MWMTPWGYSYTPPPLADFDEQMVMNVRVTEAIKSVRGTQYAFGPISTVIYQASGSTTDWTYGDQGILYACTTELSGTFTSPPSIIGETVPEVYAGYLEYCKVVAEHQ